MGALPTQPPSLPASLCRVSHSPGNPLAQLKKKTRNRGGQSDCVSLGLIWEMGTVIPSSRVTVGTQSCSRPAASQGSLSPWGSGQPWDSPPPWTGVGRPRALAPPGQDCWSQRPGLKGSVPSTSPPPPVGGAPSVWGRCSQVGAADRGHLSGSAQRPTPTPAASSEVTSPVPGCAKQPLLGTGCWGCGSLTGTVVSAEGLQGGGGWKAGAGAAPAASWGVLVAGDSSEAVQPLPLPRTPG